MYSFSVTGFVQHHENKHIKTNHILQLLYCICIVISVNHCIILLNQNPRQCQISQLNKSDIKTSLCGISKRILSECWSLTVGKVNTELTLVPVGGSPWQLKVLF